MEVQEEGGVGERRKRWREEQRGRKESREIGEVGREGLPVVGC